MALIMSDIQEIRKIASQTGNTLKKFDNRSFAAKAKDSTFQFPCLIDDTVSIDRSMAIVNYLEPVYADYVQSTLSLDSRINLATTNIEQWLKRHHQNMKLESVSEVIDLTDPLDIFKEAYKDNTTLYLNEDESMGIVIQYTTENGSELMESNRKQLSEYMSSFDMKPFPVTEKDKDKSDEFTNSQLLGAYVTGKRDVAQREENRKVQDMNLKYTGMAQAPKLLDRDVKKINNMRPYGIEIRLIAINDDGGMSNFINIVVGVKTILHLIRSDDMIYNLGNSIRNKGFLTKLVKWTSGEVSFFKDLLLHIDDIKLDVSNMSNGYTRWFPMLKRLKDRKVQLKAFDAQRLVPNATIVISSYVLDEVERQFGINLKDVRFAKKIIEDYFLMEFLIIDEATQTISKLEQGDSEFQTYALETIEREVSLNSNRLSKEIGRMISR